MIINPYSTLAQNVAEKEMLSIRSEISNLSLEIQNMIAQGENVIDNCLKDNADKEKIDFLNVFNLTENISGEVMKYLVMLYTAAGYNKVIIHGDSSHSEGKERLTKYPNQISLSFKK